jgi:hypothetical protein
MKRSHLLGALVHYLLGKYIGGRGPFEFETGGKVGEIQETGCNCVRKLRDKLSVEHRLNVDLASEVQFLRGRRGSLVKLFEDLAKTGCIDFNKLLEIGSA